MKVSALLNKYKYKKKKPLQFCMRLLVPNR